MDLGTPWQLSRWLLRPMGEHILATAGAYERVRHPQYVGLILIMIGFLLQWPTLPTLLLFPVMILLYVRLAQSEEREVAREFGAEWILYAARTPRFIPRRRASVPPRSGDHSSQQRVP